jgi:hypothetical protein
MVRKLSVRDIRDLGFDWPKYALIEKHQVLEDGKVDLTRTIERIESSRAYYRKQLNQAFNFKQQTGADYSDFTDRFDDDARMERELGQAIAYLQEITAAVEAAELPVDSEDQVTLVKELHHPFEWLPEASRRRVFVISVLLAIFVMVILQVLGRPLNTEAAPAGIVSFELAGNTLAADHMLESWGEAGRVYAGLSLGLDYLFLVAYAVAIGLGCVLVARTFSQGSRFLAAAGILLAWAQFGAALLDGLENYALIRVLLGSQHKLWPILAQWCAVPKFLIVVLGLVYVGFGTVFVTLTRARALGGATAF